jgi:hypothetical protein
MSCATQVEVDRGLVLDRDGLVRSVQAEHLTRRQDERAAEVDVAVLRSEAVEVRAADGGKDRFRPLVCHLREVVTIEHLPHFTL